MQTLAYYGGAKGQYLLIHPSGRRTVAHTPPPRKGNKPPKEEEDVGMAPEEEGEGEGDNEAVAINPPPENASVAEAKPVGLAIAGVSRAGIWGHENNDLKLIKFKDKQIFNTVVLFDT